MSYQSFGELRVWQEAKRLAVEVYGLTVSGGLAKDFGLRDQMRRAAVSIASSISEGYERNSDADFVRFLYIAKGSLSELITQLVIAKEVGFIPEETFTPIENQCNKVGAMLTKLIQSRKTAP
jgi:four helix bundle protein